MSGSLAVYTSQLNQTLTAHDSVHDSQPSLLKPQSSFHIHLISSNNYSDARTQAIVRAARQTLRDWQDAAFERLSILRQRKATTPFEQQEQLQEQIENDRKVITEAYKELSGIFRDHFADVKTNHS